MRKTIRKIGDSNGLLFNKEEVQNYGLKVGDIIDIQKHRIIKKKVADDECSSKG